MSEEGIGGGVGEEELIVNLIPRRRATGARAWGVFCDGKVYGTYGFSREFHRGCSGRIALHSGNLDMDGNANLRRGSSESKGRGWHFPNSFK